MRRADRGRSPLPVLDLLPGPRLSGRSACVLHGGAHALTGRATRAGLLVVVADMGGYLLATGSASAPGWLGLPSRGQRRWSAHGGAVLSAAEMRRRSASACIPTADRLPHHGAETKMASASADERLRLGTKKRPIAGHCPAWASNELDRGGPTPATSPSLDRRHAVADGASLYFRLTSRVFERCGQVRRASTSVTLTADSANHPASVWEPGQVSDLHLSSIKLVV